MDPFYDKPLLIFDQKVEKINFFHTYIREEKRGNEGDMRRDE